MCIYVVVQLGNKLRVVPLSLSSLCMTRIKETVQKKEINKVKRWPHDILEASQAREMSAFQPENF